MDIQKYKCIIIDDEPVAHYVLVNHIEKSINLILVNQFYNAIDALNYLRNNPVDLIFLDINMPEISGIELLNSLSNAPKTILTTAHSQYALESYEYDVIDYLLKPISLPRFNKAFNKFLSFYKKEELIEPQEITVKVDGKSLTLKTDNIEYIQSYGNYVKVFISQKTLIVSSTTQEILTELSSHKFTRIHKSFIINMNKITKYAENEVIVNKEILPIGITFKREFLEKMEKANSI
ncbi:LytTR family transcriptional regulator [Myroides marinus]|uniref:LytTR family transcriptional regulator n=1 Tax=Myroides marinus TaxID=703342 RepID=A0A165Q1S0_9FLAO|nr:response regulator transcription factor [Myroides marinus]KZE73364.1 LytTR family transcriptional regulator [Myroides marinus]